MIRNALLSTAAFAALASGSAFAADLPSRAAPAPYIAPAPIFTWTGFYVGLNAGVGFKNNNNNGGAAVPVNFSAATTPGGAAAAAAGTSQNFVFGNGFGSNGNNRSGFTGGATVGYNWQAGSLVYGLEADFNYIDRGSRGNNGSNITVVPATVTNVPGANPVAGVPFAIANGSSGGSRSDFLGTVRARLGYAADRALFFVTGGFAYGGGSNNNNGTISYYNQGTVAGAAVPVTPTAIFARSSGNNNRVGYTIGAGVEYAFTNNWTAKLEYDYIGMGRRGGNGTYFNTGFVGPGVQPAPAVAGTTPFFTGGSRNRNDLSRVIVGVNYKF